MTTRVKGSEIIERIQGDLADRIGDQMHLRANLGRSKTIEAVGVLEQAHPRIFILRVPEDGRDRRLSYSYADLLTKTVALTEVETQASLLPWLETS